MNDNAAAMNSMLANYIKQGIFKQNVTQNKVRF